MADRDKPAALKALKTARAIELKPNLLERAVAHIAPRWAGRHLLQRQAFALAGGYTGGSRGRAATRNWAPLSQDANADIIPDLPALRERSRDLVRNAPLAGGAIGTMVANVVGTGLSPRPAPDHVALGITPEAAQAWGEAALREFKLWGESCNADITRALNIYGLQGLAFRSTLENGDCLAILTDKPAPGSPYTLAVQLVEADRICNPDRGQDTATRMAGIEIDGDGATLAYHVANQHPYTYRTGSAALAWQRVPAAPTRTGRRNALMLMDKLRIGQVRGVPKLAPVIEPLKQLARYTEAELQAAVIAGMFAIFVKMDPEAFETLFDDDARASIVRNATTWDGTVDGGSTEGPGRAVNLLPGEEIDAQNPGRPNSEFDPFCQAILRQIGVGLELPFEVLIKHYTSSYSAARAALLEAWRFYRGRRDWLATAFCQPIYEALLEEAIAVGRLAAPGYFADPRLRKAYTTCQWIGDGPGSIDPAKEISAAKERVALGISSRSEEKMAYDGGDWRATHRQLAEEEAARKKDGLAVVPAPAGATAADPENVDADDAEDGAPDDAPDPAENGAAPANKRAPATARPGRRALAGAGALTSLDNLAAVLGAQSRGALAAIEQMGREAIAAREHAEALADRLEEHMAHLNGALIDRVAEPVVLHSSVSLEQADIHLHHTCSAVTVQSAPVAAEPAKPADIIIHNHVAPTPVTVNNQVDVPAAQVTVSMPPRKTETIVSERDAAGNLKRATQIETTLPE